ncbi:MAG: hypothetical protein RR396_07355, partial [Clostridiales bacterium]
SITPEILANLDQLDIYQFYTTIKANNNIVIASVNGWPITFDEFMFRAAIHEIMDNSVDYNKIFEILLEEKIKLAMAYEENLLPSPEEVNKKIQESQREESNKTIEIRNFMNNFKNTDDYWNIYERYNYFRLLHMSKLSDFIIQKGIDENKLDAEKVQHHDYYTTTVLDYYNETLLKYKKAADISLETDIAQLQFNLK